MTEARVRALAEMRVVAAMQWQFGSPARLNRLARQAAEVRPPFGALPEGRNRGIRAAEPDTARRKRRAAFLAVLLKRAYSLDGWLPPEALLHLERVDVDGRLGTVLITLTTGTRILDTGDRVTVRGAADDVAVEELAACAARRGWEAVEVTGTDEFRRAASRALLLRGVEVEDCPLSEAEQAALKDEGLGFDWAALEEEVVPLPAPRPPWAHG